MNQLLGPKMVDQPGSCFEVTLPSYHSNTMLIVHLRLYITIICGPAVGQISIKLVSVFNAKQTILFS